MHIKGIGTNGPPPLGIFYVECDEQVNLFIGPNASGKSNILRAMNGVDSIEVDRNYGMDYVTFYDSRDPKKAFTVEPSDGWPINDTSSRPGPWAEVPLLYIPATRINLPLQDLYDQTIGEPEFDDSETPFKDLFDTGSGVFYGQYVNAAIKDIRRRIVQNRDWQIQFRMALEVGYSCAKSICREIIHDDVPHSYVELDSEREFSDTGRIIHYGMGVVTSDDILGEPLYAGALSSGTQSTLLWIYALAFKIANHYRWTEGWEEKPAILLIDEIENHLHPTWQRRVIPALLEHFPKLQIFATTHSPFVVAGLKAGQVHLLKRDENGRVTATTNDKDIVGWTMDEILRTMMDVEDPTDKDTAEAAEKLRRLRKEGPRSSPEEEEKRQERIAELRQKVDRDLLAGGPWKRRREEFAERFQAALEKHGLPPDLGQENG